VRTGGDPFIFAREHQDHRVPFTVRYSTRVESSKGDQFYTVDQLQDGSWRCSCPGYFYRQEQCRHIGLVLAMLREETNENSDSGGPSG
jgi:hypothetical protein